MKLNLLLPVFILISLSITAQIPEAFNYQAAVRNSSGEIISSQNVAFRISILKNTADGVPVYVENHRETTNSFGLVTLKIGNGTVEQGVFSPSGWGSNKHFIKIEVDPNGGTSYADFGTSQLLSVPYAFHAQTVEEDKVKDDDADPENELQSLSISGTQLTLSDGGGTVTLPSSGGGDNWGTQKVVSDATLSGEGTTASPLSVNGDLTDDQTLSIRGNELSIANGNSVFLPSVQPGVWQTLNDNVFYDSGKVIIGTNTPNNNAPLTIYGKGGNSWISLTNDATGNTLNDGVQIGPISGNDAVYFWNLENSPIIFATNNKKRMEISEDGHIGIGTDPSGGARTFQVVSENELTIAAENNTKSLPTLHLDNKSGGVAAWIVGKVVIKDGTEGLHKILTSDDTGYASWQTSLWNNNGSSVYTTGKLGIGTSSPSAAMHIKGTGYPSSFMFIESSTGHDSGFRLYEGSTAKWHIFNNANAGGLQIYNSAAKTAIFAKQSNSYVGIGTTSPTQALHVVGNAYKTEGGTSWATSSDIRLKNVLGNYTKGLKEIKALKAVRYIYKKDNPRQLNSTVEQTGFVAQEVLKVFPEAVKKGDDGYLDFNIHPINIALVNAVKELNAENEQLHLKVTKLESRLEEIESIVKASALK